MNKKNFLKYTLILSLLMHALFAAFVHVYEPSFRAPPPKRTTEVELIDSDELLKRFKRPDQPQGQIVEQSDKRLNDEIDEKSKYLSKHNQKVERQTRAALNGKFQNSATVGGLAKPQQPTPGAKAEKKAPQEAEEKKSKKAAARERLRADGDVAYPSLEDLKPQFKFGPPQPQDAGTGGGDVASATDDHLKEVPTGMQTLLSTREFVYYSYYNRIKEKLRQYWEPKIKQKMERVLRQGRTIASADRITKIVILLDARGVLQRVQVIGASGLHDLDEAAVEAFEAAAPFPNPPKGIVEPDGMIRIRWDFILEANASPSRYMDLARK